MKIGCGTVLFRQFPLERALAAIREIGYEYFETQAVGPWCPHVNLERDDPESLVKLQKQYGFAGITGLWSWNGNIIANDAAVPSVIRSIEWAAAAGIPVVHFGDGSGKPGMTEEDAFGILAEKIAAITEAARAYRVRLALEPHGMFSLTGCGLSRILALAEPDVLGINYDGCNIRRAGFVETGNGKSGWAAGGAGEDELAVLRTVASRVIHCHVKDMDLAAGECVALGEGDVQVRACVQYLRSVGYDGVFSVETEGHDDFEFVVQLAKKSYDFLRNLE